MPYHFYMTVEGINQGKFRGEGLRGGHIGRIPILNFSFAVESPRDVALGKAAGANLPSVRVVKQLDSSSPQFFRAAVLNEVLKPVVLEFAETAPDGSEHVFETITLSDVYIVSVRPSGSGQSAGGNLVGSEEVVFSYKKADVKGIPLAGHNNLQSDDWTP